MNTKYCLLTNDVETTSIWFNSLRDEVGLKILKEAMPILLDIYSEHNIRSTFFFTAYIARLYPEIVKMVLKDGHEVASHGKSHLPENGFDVMPYEKQKEHLEYTKKLLEDISGQEVISFRAPALRVNSDTVRALIETRYKIDSSVASQRFDFFLSFGSFNKLGCLFSPRIPYNVDPTNIFKRGNSKLVEVPLTALVLPYVGTTMRLMPWFTDFQKRSIDIENKFSKKPVVFDIHPNEFIDESNEKRIINKRSRNPINYLLKDLLRSHLKTKNLGAKAIPLYKKEIIYFIKKNYQFATIKKYCEMNGLI